MKEQKEKLTPSSGNVFADLGMGNPEERLLKARLARAVNRAIEAKGWTQTQAAKTLGLTQPDVSDLSRGRLKNFSVERLLYCLSNLDKQVTITIRNEDDLEGLEEVILVG